MSKPFFIKTPDEATDRNFQELVRVFAGLFKGVDAKEQEVNLVTGDNAFLPTVPKPRGRIITYQTAAANLFDKGLDSAGNWVINASAPCTVRLYFF